MVMMSAEGRDPPPPHPVAPPSRAPARPRARLPHAGRSAHPLSLSAAAPGREPPGWARSRAAALLTGRLPDHVILDDPVSRPDLKRLVLPGHAAEDAD